MANPPLGQLYRHYKGGLYRFLFEVTHTENHEPMVVYVAVEPPHPRWVRPRSMFFENVDVPGYGVVPRFTPIEE
ncbi:MAG: DUF1653 domain-containing protein [Pseudomonadota bacterium]